MCIIRKHANSSIFNKQVPDLLFVVLEYSRGLILDLEALNPSKLEKYIDHTHEESKVIIGSAVIHVGCADGVDTCQSTTHEYPCQDKHPEVKLKIATLLTDDI